MRLTACRTCLLFLRPSCGTHSLLAVFHGISKAMRADRLRTGVVFYSCVFYFSCIMYIYTVCAMYLCNKYWYLGGQTMMSTFEARSTSCSGSFLWHSSYIPFDSLHVSGASCAFYVLQLTLYFQKKLRFKMRRDTIYLQRKRMHN